MIVALRNNKADGAALLRIARELQELLCGECEACKRNVPRYAVEGCDPPTYVHWYSGSKGAMSTCAPCSNDSDPSAIADVATVAEIGAWLYNSTPIVLPLTTANGQPCGLLSATVAITTTASALPRRG